MTGCRIFQKWLADPQNLRDWIRKQRSAQYWRPQRQVRYLDPSPLARTSVHRRSQPLDATVDTKMKWIVTKYSSRLCISCWQKLLPSWHTVLLRVHATFNRTSHMVKRVEWGLSSFFAGWTIMLQAALSMYSARIPERSFLTLPPLRVEVRRRIYYDNYKLRKPSRIERSKLVVTQKTQVQHRSDCSSGRSLP